MKQWYTKLHILIVFNESAFLKQTWCLFLLKFWLKSDWKQSLCSPLLYFSQETRLTKIPSHPGGVVWKLNRGHWVVFLFALKRFAVWKRQKPQNVSNQKKKEKKSGFPRNMSQWELRETLRHALFAQPLYECHLSRQSSLNCLVSISKWDKQADLFQVLDVLLTVDGDYPVHCKLFHVHIFMFYVFNLYLNIQGTQICLPLRPCMCCYADAWTVSRKLTSSAPIYQGHLPDNFHNPRSQSMISFLGPRHG